MEMARNLVGDLAELDDLTEVTIKDALKARYSRDLIYTSVRDILIAINPCKGLEIYDDKTHEEYTADGSSTDRQPHVFQVAMAAFRRMQETETNQVIIVSGESGAGKTESTKHMVRHLVHMCQRGSMELHEKIVQINPLLESFGNAKTTMNNNSSRYAKYLEISFRPAGEIGGAVVRDYMLEKSRVVHQSPGEGIFHIFYQVFAGSSRQKLDELFLTKPAREYRIMQSDEESLGMTQTYAEQFERNMDILKKIKVDTNVVLSMLAAVIHIAEIKFEENDNGVAAIAEDNDPFEPFDNAARLLGLDHTNFGEALIASTRIVQGQTIATYKTVKQANDSRDALAKMLYERMFGWLVRQININLHPNRENELANIGILDIAGFEKLRENSIEQLCINLVNEKLQNFMNKKIFTMEIEIYQQEGVELEGIQFKNNDDILSMFNQEKEGLLAILDEVSRFQQGSDTALVQRFKKQFTGNSIFIPAKSDRPEFFIQHFAALVNYNADGFVEKNRDRLNDELSECMKKSADEFISDLFTVKRGPTGTISATMFNYRESRRARGIPVMPPGSAKLKPTPKGQVLANELGKSLKKKFGNVQKPQAGMSQVTPAAKSSTLVSYFKKSLLDLLRKLETCEPFFIRCIKANGYLRPDDFDDTVVSDQLRYNGLAQVAKIRKMGYAVRKEYKDFIRKFRSLVPGNLKAQSDRDQAKEILLQLPAGYHRDFRCGKTRVFLTNEVNEWLETWLSIYTRGQQKAAKLVAKCVRVVATVKRSERLKREEEARQRMLEQQRKAAEEGGSDSEDGGNQGNSDGSDQGSSDGRKSPERSPSPLPGPSSTITGKLGETLRETVPRGDHQYRPPSPPASIDERDSGASRKAEKENANKAQEKAFWDICQLLARERKTRDVHEERYLQVIKVITYIFLFVVLIWCCVCQKISLLVLATHQYNRTENRPESEAKEDAVVAAGRHVLLTLAILIPYILIFITSFFKWLFGNFTMPQRTTLLFCFIIELLHTVGLCILCFHILPELDIVRGIMLMSGVGIVPALLAPVCVSETKSYHKSGQAKDISNGHRVLVFLLDIATIVVQCGYIPIILLTKHFLDDSDGDSNTRDIVLFVVGMIFISFSWWENFVDDRFCGPIKPKSSWYRFIIGVKFDLQESRPVISFFMSVWKICLTVLLSWIAKENFFEYSTEEYLRRENASNVEIDEANIAKVTFSEIFDKLGSQELAENSAILTLTLTGFVGHYISYTACKLKMQVVSFNIPLMLSTPIAAAIAFYECFEADKEGVGFLSPFTKEAVCWRDEDYNETFYHYIIGVGVLVSMYWLARHIFYPDIERLAKTERMFLNPYYCGILFEQHMILNRRRHNRKVHKEIREGKVSFRLSSYNTSLNIEDQEEENPEEREKPTNNDGVKYSEDVRSDSYINPKYRDIPMIYACATMWHENKLEMVQLLKSLFRMDRDQCLRRHAEQITRKPDKDFYDFEAHILFDDAMELNDNNEFVPNSFVRMLMSVIEQAASSVYERQMKIKPPFKVPTPYGGQLIYTLPGDNFMFIHLKDKNKIRHRKRWSQVMYMYYLLGFRIVRMSQETVTNAMKSNRINELMNWGDNKQEGQPGRSHIFQAFDEQVIRKANNTFLLALDGDVDFTPGAVRLLLDRMRKSEKVGAACGRIHPIGSGPVVWFQMFEYAIAHWLQKATEHVLGCVLCSPGCFSMFRGSALMDDNIMKKYTILPTEAQHHLMYDMGEDRWLCTLLLQQGYRVDYAAGSDAFTYAPEGFAEFFNQRRRWMPSTVANIIDLLSDYKNTVYVNSNVSMLYILYQGALLISTIVGPATVLMMIAGANLLVFQVNLWYSYLIALLPACFYFALCFYVKPKWQIMVAEIMTGFYAFIMMIVLVGTIVQAAQNSPFHPSVMFLAVLFFMFAFAAVLHPKEWSCVVFGMLYFLLVPTGFLLLNIYSLCNLHIVSWGTREVAKKKTPEEEAAEKERLEKKKKKKERGFFGRLFPEAPLKDVKEIISKLTDMRVERTVKGDEESLKVLKEISEGIAQLVDQRKTEGTKGSVTFRTDDQEYDEVDERMPVRDRTTHVKHKGILKHPQDQHKKPARVSIADSIKVMDDGTEEPIYDKVPKKRNELVNPAWIECESLGNGQVISMVGEELKFWQGFIEKYLYPLEIKEEDKKKTQKELIELRNNVCLAMAMINMLWVAINFMFQLTSPTKVPITLTSGDSDSPANLEENQDLDEDDEPADNRINVDLLGLAFIFFYLIILVLQFFGMLIHRWGTFLHLVSVTELRNPFKRVSYIGSEKKEIDHKKAIKIVEDIFKEPTPDYPSDNEDDSDTNEEIETRKELENLQKTGTRFSSADGNLIGASTRQLDVSRRPNTNDQSVRILSRSTRLLNDGLVRGGFIDTPDLQKLQHNFQDNYRKAKDSKYKDRQLPPVKKRQLRLNLGAGRSELEERLNLRETESRDRPSRPLIEEEEDDHIYDVIPRGKGTVSKEIGRKMKLMLKSVRFDEDNMESRRSGRQSGRSGRQSGRQSGVQRYPTYESSFTNNSFELR